MDWDRLAQAIIDRRAALGYRTREALAAAASVSSRLLADLEKNRRQNYDRITIARVEGALEWEPGTVNTILRGGPYPGMPTSKPEPRDIAAELMTASGVLGNLFVNRMDLTEEIHDPRLGPEARYHLIRMVRLDDVERDRQLRAKVAAEKQRMIEAGEHEA